MRVAYLLAELVDGDVFIAQVSVHPDSGRRGIGRSLIDHAARQAVAEGIAALTLTTFSQVRGTHPTTNAAASGA
jgi:ribosomal protein S18 acetylase RimI-like enzyme